jgi:hypothetical protein
MQKRRLGQSVQLVLLAIAVISCGATTMAAALSSSSSYQVTETEFVSGSSAQNCSGQFCAQTSIGDMTAGDATSTTYKTKFGSLTGSDPLLEVIVDPGVSDLGVLTAEHTATKTTIVRIRNYLSSGYILQIVGEPPKVAGHTLSTPSSPTASTPGTEQFAINAAANTTPLVGAGPVQVPSDQTSFGVVNDAYRTSNLFKFNSGDVVAHSNKESGRTDYTISMIVNISNKTPAGHYSGDFAAIVIPIY